MQRQNILLGTLAMAVVVAAIGGVVYALHTRAQADGAAYPGLHAPVSVVCPGPTDRVSDQGLPAVRPRNDCTPSFTQQDVQNYLAQGVSLGKIGVTGRPTVTRSVFLTIGDLGHISGDSEWAANYPADLVVCYAQLSGAFTVSGPPGFSPKSQNVAFIVFDGHTGNQLVMGTGAPLG